MQNKAVAPDPARLSQAAAAAHTTPSSGGQSYGFNCLRDQERQSKGRGMSLWHAQFSVSGGDEYLKTKVLPHKIPDQDTPCVRDIKTIQALEEDWEVPLPQVVTPGWANQENIFTPGGHKPQIKLDRLTQARNAANKWRAAGSVSNNRMVAAVSLLRADAENNWVNVHRAWAGFIFRRVGMVLIDVCQDPESDATETPISKPPDV